MPPPDGLSGGDKLAAYLANLAKNLDNAAEVKVGFLEGGTYPDGTSIPTVAAIMEFGGKIDVAAHDVTLYRKTLKDGSFARNDQFVRKDESNFASDHVVPAHVITLPPRPYFRRIIAEHSGEWGEDTAKALAANNGDAAKALALMGQKIEGQLRQSITDLVDPPLAKSTIAAKGFDKPLIDTGVMRQSIDSEVTGTGE